MSTKHVYHFSDLDDADHWCEACGHAPKGVKVYIDEYKGCNPAFWCEKCVQENVCNLNFNILGWVTREEYIDLQRKYISTNWPRY